MARLTDEQYQKKVVEKVKELKLKMDGNSDSDNPEKINPIVVALLVSPDGNEKMSYRSECLEGDHAEYNLFINKLIGENHSHDTLYVSLEPCNYDSRLNTISCSELIVKSGIKKVFIGSFDPDIIVRGNGYAFLIENNIDVQLFKEEYQKELIDNNWPFFSDKLFCNENQRRFLMKYKDQLSIDAIIFYFYLLDKKNNEILMNYKNYETNSNKLLKKFYNECFEKKYIYSSIKNGKRIIESDMGFDLAFFKNPSNKFKGAFIKIIDNHNGEIKPIVFDEPLLISFCKSYEYICKILNKLTNNNNVNIIIRELLANAVFHKDYNSYTPVIVKINNENVTISNPCKNDYIDISHLNHYDMPTNILNGCLTEIATNLNLMEGQGRGEETLKKMYGNSIQQPYNLICNILNVSIPLK